MHDGSMDLISLENFVRRYFTVEDFFIQFNVPTFIIHPEPDVKSSFIKFYNDIKASGYLPMLRMVEGKITLKIFRVQEEGRKSGVKTARIIV
ncbi:MAG: hypothetical protein QXI93_02415, partial [Candidatus Methanomethylicia archaeon]